ncbi:UvrD-helicase domain-containing protein [Romboutsia hominis]|uniref:DNA 3'-5' helicase n=1 Tax=Romboutsia hominis TaxID=1507512 RepID=A0A2P2BQF3_9FIRM|nr:UvrD-helicase domain-containing protein [Romboutsia hominis]CEI72578.1 UvrD/REP helicase [Romboutsia hominis]
MSEIISKNDLISFFSNIAEIWQHHIDYNFFKDIELSPDQIKIIDHDEDQMLINGYAGTGKSITLLYKFINTILREAESKKILYISYNYTLIADTIKKLNDSEIYMKNKHRHEIDVTTYHEMAYKLLRKLEVIDGKKKSKLTQEEIIRNDQDALRRIGVIVDKYKNPQSEEYEKIPKDEKLYSTHDARFIKDEIKWMKENGFVDKPEYIEVERKGRSRSIRLTKKQRNTIYKIFEVYNKMLKEQFHNHMDLEDYALEIIRNKKWIKDDLKYDYVFVDEVQDLQPMQIKTLVMLTKKSLIISGDPRQTIHRRSPYSYEKLGINITERGRNRVLNKNYRCSAQTMRLANSLNFDNGEHKLDKRNFVREGDKPLIVKCENANKEMEFVINKIKEIFDENPNETVAVIHREESEISNSRYSDRLKALKGHFLNVSDSKNYSSKFNTNKTKQILYTSAYDIKGLEFDHTFLIQFNDEHYPQKYQIEELLKNQEMDESMLKEDIDEIKNIEKKLLYVAMTRAKKNLYMTYSGNISEFSNDFESQDYETQIYK